MENPPNSLILERKSLADQIFIHIKRMILSQELKGGDAIPEEKIAKIFGVSRTPIRETLRKLEKYGLVAIKPHSQATVVRIGPKEALYIGEVRNAIETLAVQSLAKKASPEDIQSLTGIAENCAAAAAGGNVREAFEADGLFHLEIARRCDNPYIFSILKNLEVKIQLVRIMYYSLTILPADTHIHDEIIGAIERRDPQTAAALMRRHINDFIQHFQEGGAPFPIAGSS